jgi:hypothetical protein
MRPIAVSLACLALLALTPLPANALDRWVYLGDVKIQDSSARGKLSLNLDSLRKRVRHYEIWERIVVESEPGQRTPALEEAAGERLTLWAIRCRFGEMARVTSGSAGSFEPRAEPLRFYTPRPGSPGATVIDTTCTEARRVAAELRALNPAASAPRAPRASGGLEAPPSVFDQNDFEYGDE